MRLVRDQALSAGSSRALDTTSGALNPTGRQRIPLRRRNNKISLEHLRVHVRNAPTSSGFTRDMSLGKPGDTNPRSEVLGAYQTRRSRPSSTQGPHRRARPDRALLFSRGGDGGHSLSLTEIPEVGIMSMERSARNEPMAFGVPQRARRVMDSESRLVIVCSTRTGTWHTFLLSTGLTRPEGLRGQGSEARGVAKR